MFNPTEENLGDVNEGIAFMFSITYDGVDEFMVPISYPVTITAQEIISGVTISNETISGQYNDSFNNTIQYLNDDKVLTTTDKFNKISNLHEMVKYAASQNRTKVFNYTANAMDGMVIVDTKTYTITVQNDWTSGKNLLKFYVGAT